MLMLSTISRFRRTMEWLPRSQVLRCLIEVLVQERTSEQKGYSRILHDQSRRLRKAADAFISLRGSWRGRLAGILFETSGVTLFTHPLSVAIPLRL